jgi:hypothetical protein
MSVQGTTTIDFGAYPGKADARLAITGQAAIGSGALVDAWIMPAATADHSIDEHVAEQIDVMAGDVVAGTGFTIFARGRHGSLYGLWSVAWVWNN